MICLDTGEADCRPSSKNDLLQEKAALLAKLFVSFDRTMLVDEGKTLQFEVLKH